MLNFADIPHVNPTSKRSWAHFVRRVAADDGDDEDEDGTDDDEIAADECDDNTGVEGNAAFEEKISFVVDRRCYCL